MFDFDEINDWGPNLQSALTEVVPTGASERITETEPEYIEDARDSLLDLVGDRQALVAAVIDWIEAQSVSAYHGSRLTSQEALQICRDGLRVLRSFDREPRLRTALSQHPCWPGVEPRLGEVLNQFGPEEYGGRREGQVHATLSRAGLVRGFNHYLTHGSEFDQRVAHELLGKEGVDLLAAYGTPTVFHLQIPGLEAMRACNPYPALLNDIPNLIREVLNVWSYWLAYPDYEVTKLELDCGLIFYEDIGPEWIVETITLGDRELGSG